jgi:hypothetical protein
MRLRKLRIAWSAACGIACVLLIALWARSYTWGDTLTVPISQSWLLSFSSGQGVLLVHLQHDPRAIQTSRGWSLRHISMVKMDRLKAQFKQRGGPASVIDAVNRWGLSVRTIRTPHWFPVLLSAALCAVPWMRWRFRLRTLLIATTLVAVTLGLICYAIG